MAPAGPPPTNKNLDTALSPENFTLSTVEHIPSNMSQLKPLVCLSVFATVAEAFTCGQGPINSMEPTTLFEQK